MFANPKPHKSSDFPDALKCLFKQEIDMATGISFNTGVLNNNNVVFIDTINDIIAANNPANGVTIYTEPVSGRNYIQYGTDNLSLSAAGKAVILKLFGYDPAYGSSEPYNFGNGDTLPPDPNTNGLGGVAYKDPQLNAYAAIVFPSRAPAGLSVDDIAVQELTHHFLLDTIPISYNEVVGDAASLLLNGNYVNYLITFNAADVLGQQS
jgi:hypothetical protein